MLLVVMGVAMPESSHARLQKGYAFKSNRGVTQTGYAFQGVATTQNSRTIADQTFPWKSIAGMAAGATVEEKWVINKFGGSNWVTGPG
jgi:hypothetical protein